MPAVQATDDNEEKTKRSVTDSLIVMVAGMKEIATQIAIIQDTFGIKDEETKFETLFQTGAKSSREEDEVSSVGASAAARQEAKWSIVQAAEEEAMELQTLGDSQGHSSRRARPPRRSGCPRR